jgi:hypothetical protein
MAKKPVMSVKLYLDAVERKFLAQMQRERPEYAALDLGQIAHLELKTHLLGKARENLKSQEKNPLQNSPVVMRSDILSNLSQFFPQSSGNPSIILS